MPKEVFLQVLKRTAYFTQLVVCPFGLPPASTSAALSTDEFTNIYHQWEEAVSRSLYNSRGIADSSIAASMHEYVEKQQDSEVWNSLRIVVCLEHDCILTNKTALYIGYEFNAFISRDNSATIVFLLSGGNS